MGEWFNALPEIEKVFVASTLLGGAIFVIRLLMGMFVGGDDLADGDDVPAGGDAALASFRILSLQGLSAFTVMFGLVGLALTRQQATSGPLAVAGGFAAGLATVWVIGRVFIGIGKLETDGTIQLSRVVGVEGTVDLTIPANGIGKVRLIVQQHLRVYEARSTAQVPLHTGDRVKVVDVLEGNMLVVEPGGAAASNESGVNANV